VAEILVHSPKSPPAAIPDQVFRDYKMHDGVTWMSTEFMI